MITPAYYAIRIMKVNLFSEIPLVHSASEVIVRPVNKTELLIELFFSLSGQKAYHHFVSGLQRRFYAR